MERTERYRENENAQDEEGLTAAQKEKEEEMPTPENVRPGSNNNGYRRATQIRNKTMTKTATSIHPANTWKCRGEIYVAYVQCSWHTRGVAARQSCNKIFTY